MLKSNSLLIAFLTLVIACHVQAQFDHPEYDLWRGCSLGIRLEEDDGKFRVSNVHPYSSGETDGFREDDELISVGQFQASAGLASLGEFLEKTRPNTLLRVKVKRGEEHVEFDFRTLRKPLVDAAAIVTTLRSSQVVRNHLKATGRPDFLDQMTGRMVRAVQESTQPRLAYEAMNALIDEIDVSHSAIVARPSFQQFMGEEAGDIGLTLQRHRIQGRNGYFVVDRMPGTVGFDSPVLLGDEILFVNGIAIENSRRLILAGEEQRHELFFVHVDLDEEVRLEYRQCSGGPMQTIRMKPTESVTAVDAMKNSARVIEHGEHRFAYIRIWNLMSMEVSKVLKDNLDEAFADCDGLILDLRGRGGTIPTVIAVANLVKKMDKPVVAVTDRLSRSGKELLTHLIKDAEHVTVIGERTAGAVTGATMSQLPSGNALMYPAVSGEVLKRFSDGVVLEGNGVHPHIPVPFHIPFCQGNDLLLNFALMTASEKAAVVAH